MRRSVVAVALSALSLVFLTSTNTSAQSTYGAIHGIVREGSGEPVAGATVIVTSVEKGTQFRQKTNNAGHYEFPQLLPESYDLAAEAAGRKTITQDISVVADGEALCEEGEVDAVWLVRAADAGCAVIGACELNAGSR